MAQARAALANAALSSGRLATLREAAAALVAARVTTPSEAVASVKTA
jgi:hypothetical protein